MPTAAEILASANQRIRIVLADMIPKQAIYHALTGRYWQGMRTHSVVPADGATSAPTLNVKPSDQAEDWSAFGATLPALLECALSVTTYSGSRGDGWVLVAEVEINGNTWQRSAQVGPESGRTTGWVKVGA